MDWIDQGAQPLSFAHYFNSGDVDGEADVGMGKGWKHSWISRVKLPTNQGAEFSSSVSVQMPDGTSVLFFKGNSQSSAWVAASGTDRIQGTMGGQWKYYLSLIHI